jgi:hypothetical protein
MSCLSRPRRSEGSYADSFQLPLRHLRPECAWSRALVPGRWARYTRVVSAAVAWIRTYHHPSAICTRGEGWILSGQSIATPGRYCHCETHDLLLCATVSEWSMEGQDKEAYPLCSCSCSMLIDISSRLFNKIYAAVLGSIQASGGMKNWSV